MCELLVRTVDKAPLNTPEAEARVSQRGDVITIQEDGWAWSERERTNPAWVIVKVPGAPAINMAAFVANEPGDAKLNKYLRRRHFSFDLDRYDARKTLTESAAHALRLQKKPVADPAAIGGPRGVIGS